jgi:hypothetical protein
MKATLRISIWLNLALLGGLIFVVANWRQKESASALALSEARSPAPVATAPTAPALSGMESEPFRWSRLESTKDYRIYVANLRAIGCPEATLEDIVRGDADRAYSWERNQLGLDEAGAGPWSRSREMQLVASLLGGQLPTEAAASAQSTGNSIEENSGGEVAQTPVPSQGAKAEAPSYPLFLQNANWSALGFDADQQAAIAQVRQQFLGEINGLNQNPNDSAGQNSNPAIPSSSNPAPLTQWQTALQNADNQLRDLLGGQGYMAYEQRQYYAWYQPQVVAANAEAKPLTINPGAFSVE